MAIIRPFKGIFYNQKKIDIANVTAPPYDIIAKEESQRLEQRSRYNIVRLIGGKVIPSLCEGQKDSYKQAGNLFHKWLEKAILIQANKVGIYIYRQKYSLPLSSDEKTRFGFFCLLKMPQQGKGIFPHERTFSFPVSDRLKLLQESKANFSALFGLYEDKQKEISSLIKGYLKRRAKIDFCDTYQIQHSLWAVEDETDIEFVLKRMRAKPIYIADGHHRYAAALRFHQKVKTKESSFVLAYLAEMNEENISILPTHRVLFLNQKEKREFLKKIAEFFRLKCIEPNLYQNGKKDKSLEIYWQGHYYLLTPKFSFYGNSLALLHNIVMKKILDIKPSQEKEKIRYTHSRQEAIELGNNKNGAVFFIEPFRLQEIKEIISKRKVLPRKSTYFYPKLLSGMVVRGIEKMTNWPN